MTTVTFDTLELVKRLETSGILHEQAEAIVRSIADAQDQLVTKADLEISLAPIKTDLAVLEWMIGMLFAVSLSIALKLFI